MKADNIFVLEKGKIVESGKHKYLLDIIDIVRYSLIKTVPNINAA